jgi:predicted phage replisome organizer
MADVKWIKIVTDVFDDQKVRFIETMPNGDEIIVIWFKLICLAGKCNSGGFLMMTDRIAYTEEMLASIFNRDIKLIHLAINTFETLDMVEVIDNAIYISNWEKHQNAEKLEHMREQNKIRQTRYRHKQIGSNAKTVTQALCDRNSNATDIDKESKNKNKDNIPPYPLEEFHFGTELEDQIHIWLKYKSERKESYKPTGFKTLLGTIKKQADEHGDQAVIDLINICMASNWQGIIWDKLVKKDKPKSNLREVKIPEGWED